jgi:hypothetical protein
MGGTTRLMLANAITDAKYNFFIQCSWELPKWRSMFMHTVHALAMEALPFSTVELRGVRINDTIASYAALDGL